VLRFLIVALIAPVLFAGGYSAWNWWSSRSPSTAQIQGEPIAARTVGELTISLFGDLHNGQSEVLVRFAEYEGLSYEEISSILRCSIKAVEMKLYRARKSLREKLVRSDIR
jgi:DNA-directed RNA polymerase specialized sigma24 family protein